MRILTDATDRALRDIADLQRDGYIDTEMAQRARDVVGLLFQQDSVYASIAPDDGGVCFYWRGGNRSITIDLFPKGSDPAGDCWQCVRNGDNRVIHCNGGVRREMYDALAAFSAYVQNANPNWRALVDD